MAPHAREHPRSYYEQPVRRPRSILDSELSRRNPVLRYPTREYQSDRASRTRHACRPLSRAHTPHHRRPTVTATRTHPPYQWLMRPSRGVPGTDENVCARVALGARSG